MALRYLEDNYKYLRPFLASNQLQNVAENTTAACLAILDAAVDNTQLTGEQKVGLNMWPALMRDIDPLATGSICRVR